MAIRRTTGRLSVCVLSTSVWLFLNLTLCHLSAAAIFGGGHSHTPAAIFGLGSKETNDGSQRQNNNQYQQQQQQQQQQRVPQDRRLMPPPPPPNSSSRGQQTQSQSSQFPPPPPTGTNTKWSPNSSHPPPPPMTYDPSQRQRIERELSSHSNVTKKTVTRSDANTNDRLPLPMQQSQSPNFYGQHQLPPPPPPGWRPRPDPNEGTWMAPPPPQPFQDWQQTIEYRDDANANANQWEMNQGLVGDNNNDSLLRDLDESIQRERGLLQTVQNMTASVASMEQREELHVRQLDVLTERVMDVEASAAVSSNSLKEYQVNCTALGQQVALSQGQVEEWKNRCSEFADQHDEDEEVIVELKLSLKKATVEAEDLAGMIEKHRLEQGLELYSKRKQKKKKSRGFFGWLFGMSVDDDDWDEMHEAARSTLLKALQTERNNVEELESTVTSLQTNNSAIADQVNSRDLIIDELNDRIAVFEEDKVVLKAALRQLQKEMNDEAPKTQKLVDDLASAQKEVERLRHEIESLISTQQNEIVALQKAISKKQSTIQQKESNLTIIGTYVDKMEERLADFAVARRDITVREQKCEKLETAVADAERERDAMRANVERFETEHEELKKLLEEIARERTKLRKDISQLELQRSRLEQEGGRMRESVKTRDIEIQRLKESDAQWNAQTRQLNAELEQTKASYEELQAALRDAESSTSELRHNVDTTLQARGELQDILDQTEAAKNELQVKLSSLETERHAAEAAKNELQVKREAERRAAEAANKAAIVPDKSPKHPVAVAKNTTELDLGNSSAPEKYSSSPRADGSKKHIEDRPLQSANRPIPPPPPPAIHTNARLLTSERLLVDAKAALTANETMRVPANATAKPSMPAPEAANVTSAPKTPAAGKDASGKRKVPLRNVRKFFSKTTGLHGFFSRPPSPKLPTGMASNSTSTTKSTIVDRRPKAPDPITRSTIVDRRPKKSDLITSRQRPDVLSHTLGGLKTSMPKSTYQKDKKP